MTVANNRQRLTVTYSGRVQGVGFRYTTRSIADGYNVTGYVRNLTDGRVELVAEGERRAVDNFLVNVRDRLSGFIRDEKTDVQTATGEFPTFGIRH